MSTGTERKNSKLDATYGDAHSSALPSSMKLRLYEAAPTDDGGGTVASYAPYADVTIANDSTNWPDAEDGQKSNGVAFAFPTPTADGPALVAWALHGPIGDDVIDWEYLSEPMAVVAGQAIEVPVDAIVIVQTN